MIKTKKLTILFFLAIVFSLILCGSSTAADPSNSTLSTDQSINTQNTTSYPDPQIIRGGTSTGIIYTTIQDAINNAQTGDTIRLDNGATFNEHDLTIPVEITSLTFDAGPGGYATIDAQNYSRIVTINSGVTVNFNNITFVNGYKLDSNGSAVYNSGSCNFTGCNFNNNRIFISSNPYIGGAIYNSGDCTLTGCNFNNNYAYNGYGGAINQDGGSCTITNCNFNNNGMNYGSFGGAINVNSGNCSITGCNFNNNSVDSSGGAINQNYGNCTIINCNFQNNTSTIDGGAINFNSGSCAITDCYFISNIANNGWGGAINELGSVNSANCTITNSTFDNNSASNGGAIYNGWGNCTLNECSFTNNTADQGSAIYDYSGIAIIQFNRIVNNNGNYDVYRRFDGSGNGLYNWWGTNFQGTNPQSAGRTNFNISNWLVLTVTSSPTIIPSGGISVVTADLQHDNYGNPVSGGQVHDGISVTFQPPSTGTYIPPIPTTLTNSQAQATFSSAGLIGGTSINVSATVDSETQQDTIKIGIVTNTRTLKAFNTIQAAINDPNTQTGDTLRLENGVTFNEHDITIPVGITSLNFDVWNASHTGPGGFATIDAQNSGRIITINSGVTVNFNNLTLKNGNANIGGAIYNNGNLTINNCIFTGNTATDNNYGGGAIFNISISNISGCTFTGNTATGQGWGGGAIYTISGTVNVSGCTFTANTARWGGGAILVENSACTVNVSGCTFTGNTATTVAGGGAIFNWGNVNVTGSTFTSNTALADKGGAIFNRNNLTVSGCTFTSNTAQDGGAIVNLTGNTCHVSDSTFTGNRTNYDGFYGGGAIFNLGTMDVNSSTFTSNSANYKGGAIYNQYTLNINGCTFISNTARDGGAIYNDSGTRIATVNFNRIIGNTTTFGIGSAIYCSSGSVNATNNWWGSNTDPRTISNLIIGTVNANTWIILTVSANPGLISPLGDTSTVTADLLHDNNHQIPIGGQVPDGILVTFSLNPSWGTITNIIPMSSKTSNGEVTATYNANGSNPYPHSVQVYASADSENNAYITIQLDLRPSLNPIGDKSVDENQLLNFTLVGTDPDVGDLLAYSATGLPVGATLDLNTGVFSWTPSFSQSGTYPVTFTVTDNGGLSDSKTVNIVVNNVNRVPTLNSIGDKSVDENQLLNFTLVGTDPDSGNVLAYSATGLPVGAALDPNTGVFSWTPSFSQSGTYPVTFTVTDVGGLFDSKTVNINVNNVNRAPSLVSPGDKSIDENQLLNFTLVGTDPDSGDVLTYSATGLPVGAALDPNTGVFSWTLSFSQSGTYPVNFTVTDVGGLFDSKTVNINVNNVNRAPVLVSPGDKSVNENQLLTFTLVSSDPDVGDTLTYSATGLPVGATLDPNTGVFGWTPGFDQSGTYPVTLTVTDNGGLKASQTINIRVNNVNRAPILNSVGDKVINENQLLTFTLQGNDPDAGDTLAYSATGLPAGAVLNHNTGVFSWTPSFSQSGTYKVTFTVTDTGGLSDSKTVTITVNNVNIADLQVKVVSSDSLPAVDRKFAFMVYIKNNGPNDATNVSVNVPIPTGLTYNYYISTQGTYNGSVWTLGKIKSGSRVFLYICATPQTAYLDKSVTLTATPTMKEYDPTPVPGSTTIKISRISRMALVLFSVFMLYEIFQG